MVLKTTADYAEQIARLLPPGPAWELSNNPRLKANVESLAAQFQAVDRRAHDLQQEMYPGTMLEMLEDWEAVMKLPDPCMGESATLGERRREVIRRFVSHGEQSRPYFLDLAIRMGYPDAEIIEWRTPRFGNARFGHSRFGSWRVQFVWTLDLKTRKLGDTRFGLTTFGQRFGANLNAAIECVIKRYAPAHTVVFFKYG